MRRAMRVAVLAVVSTSCGSSNPSGPESAPPTTTLAPSPSPSPTPTPTPTPSPSPTPSGNQNPVSYVAAMVTSFLHNGQLQRGARASYQPGDVLYLTCTPKDRYGVPTKNHGRIQDWNFFSDDLEAGRDFSYTDTRTFNPDVHVSETSRTGQIQARCRVDFMDSGRAIMNIVAP